MPRRSTSGETIRHGGLFEAAVGDGDVVVAHDALSALLMIEATRDGEIFESVAAAMPSAGILANKEFPSRSAARDSRAAARS